MLGGRYGETRPGATMGSGGRFLAVAVGAALK